MPRSITPALRLDSHRARAHWHLRQGLAEPIAGSLDEIVAATGWVRTLGGVDVYLAVRARAPGMKRVDLDKVVAEGRLSVIPAVRGCIYLVPRAELPVAMRVAEEQYKKRTERELEKVGVPESEIAAVGEAVVGTLKKGPLSTDALRKALPAGVLRSLGEKGKKVGMSATLPTALRYLEFDGKVERTLAGERLDSERYEWRLPQKNPFAGAKIPREPTQRYALIARSFFRHAGPASVEDFASWTGLSQRDAKAAMERAGLSPVAVEGYADEAFVVEEDLPILREAAKASASVSMLAFEDNYLGLHGGPRLLVDPKHHGREVPQWGQKKGSTLGEVKHLAMRAVFDGDRLVGFWEFDAEAGKVVVGAFEELNPVRMKAVAARAEDVGNFLSEDMGHAKSYTLDTAEAIRERAAAVKAI